MKKYFKDNKQYFNFINKNKNKINVLRVKTINDKKAVNKIIMLYEVLVWVIFILEIKEMEI